MNCHIHIARGDHFKSSETLKYEAWTLSSDTPKAEARMCNKMFLVFSINEVALLYCTFNLISFILFMWEDVNDNIYSIYVPMVRRGSFFLFLFFQCVAVFKFSTFILTMTSLLFCGFMQKAHSD